MKTCNQLSQDAADYKFNPRVPLKLYLKTCVSLLEEAQGCFQQGDLERSYVMYVRYLDLCMKKLPGHPQVAGPSADVEHGLAKKEYLQLLKLEVPAILKISEDLRAQLERLFAKHSIALASSAPRPRAASKDAPEKTELPASFDEARFRQSLSSLQRHGDNTLAQRESNLAYPELPQLSVPFSAGF